MSEILNAQKQVEFLNLVNEELTKKDFIEIDDEIGPKEKIIGQATDYEKAIFTANQKTKTQREKIVDQIESEKTRPDLSEEEKKKIINDLKIEISALESNIEALGALFWGSISCRFKEEKYHWNSMALRKNWNIVGFDVEKEHLKKNSSPIQRLVAEQAEVLGVNNVNITFFENQAHFQPEESLTENEQILGEMNAYEKCIFVNLKENAIKMAVISEKIKEGKSFDIVQVKIVQNLINAYDNLLWSSLLNRFGENLNEINSNLGIRKNWKIVLFREDNGDQ